MPSFKKSEFVELSEYVEVTTDVATHDFMDACTPVEISEVLWWLKSNGHLTDGLPDDGSNSDHELNATLAKISDARMQLTNDDLDDLKRIAGKYR